jgi:hypothetical protein
VDELYAVRPEEFVAARSALVKQLKAEGRKDDAAAVAKLRRPSVAAWALNQVAREHPDLVTAALAAGERLRAASDAALAGRPGELRDATAAERAAASAVVKAAAAHLGARVDATAPALLATIRVAALDEAVADQLRRGVLVTEQEQPGFGFGLDTAGPGLSLVPPLESKPKTKARTRTAAAKPPAAGRGAPKTPSAAAARQAERQRTERAAARAAERARQKELVARQRTAQRKERDAVRLAKEAEEAEASAVAARALAARARADADAARQAVDELG